MQHPTLSACQVTDDCQPQVALRLVFKPYRGPTALPKRETLSATAISANRAAYEANETLRQLHEGNVGS